MDNIEINYQKQIQQHLEYIRLVSEACQKRCEELKQKAEEEIGQLGGQNKEKEIKIKVLLKKNLDKVIEEFEKEMRRSFGNNLITLEEIYHQKELLTLQEIENQFTGMPTI